MSRAAVEAAALLGLFDQDVRTAFGTFAVGLLVVRLRVAALRESGAAEEFSVRPVLYDHVLSAQFADSVRNLICDADLLEILLRLIDSFLEIRVEVSDTCLPVHFSDLPAVEQALHGRREIDVHYARK